MQVSQVHLVLHLLWLTIFDATGKRVEALPVIKTDLVATLRRHPPLRLWALDDTTVELEIKPPIGGFFVSVN